MAILSKYVNQILLNHTTVLNLALPGLHFNFVECEFFLVSSSPDIHALRRTNLDNSIYSSNFFVRGYLHLM